MLKLHSSTCVSPILKVGMYIRWEIFENIHSYIHEKYKICSGLFYVKKQFPFQTLWMGLYIMGQKWAWPKNGVLRRLFWKLFWTSANQCSVSSLNRIIILSIVAKNLLFKYKKRWIFWNYWFFELRAKHTSLFNWDPVLVLY